MDGLRAIAAIAVFVCHLNGYWPGLTSGLPWKLPQLMEMGQHGVDLFVVISGFCLALPILGRDLRMDLTSFLGRRAFRILPPYYVALAIAATLALLPSTYSLVVGQRASWSDVVLHAFVMQSWVPDALGTINGSLWSVSLEVQLYLIFPLLVLGWRRWGFGPVAAMAAALSLGWQLLAFAPGIHDYAGGVVGSIHSLPDRLVQFVVGAACAALWHRGRVPRWQLLLLLFVPSAVGAAAMDSAGPDFGHTVVWTVPSALAVLLMTTAAGRWLSLPKLSSFGQRSYSFYLLHQPAILLMATPVTLLPGGWLVQLTAGGLVTFAVAWIAGCLLFALVERPAHHKGRRIFASPHPVS